MDGRRVVVSTRPSVARGAGRADATSQSPCAVLGIGPGPVPGDPPGLFLQAIKEVDMPQLLETGLPERRPRTKFDFAAWADGQAWKFVKGEDYDSSTETFRYNIRRWARERGYDVELRPYPALDADGHDVPLSKQDAVAVGVI